MNKELRIADQFILEVTRRTPTAVSWVKALPKTVYDLFALWDLTLDGEPMYGKTSMVLPVISNQRKAAVKLVSPVVEMEAEARALQLFAGAPVVELLAISRDHKAMLLERLEHTFPGLHETPMQAVSIAGEIAANIGSIAAPAGVRSLAEDASGWLIGIQQQHERASASGTNFTLEQFALTLEIIHSMQFFSSETMTHGDLSMDNILRAQSGRWVAIDPLLVCGPITNEAHTVVRSFLPEIVESDSPVQILDDLTRAFCESAQASVEEARRISFARYVASFYWESQNGESSESAARLRAGALHTYEAIRST